MQARIKIAFQAMDETPEIRGAIEEHVANLEQRLGPVRTCRVVIKGPGARDRADRYGVNIRLALTQGLEVKVGPPPRQDERYADLTFAINDTFRRARRRLQDHVRRQPKKPERQPSGRIAELEPGEVASAGTPRGVLPSPVAATADMPQPITSFRYSERAIDIGSAGGIRSAEGSHGRPEPERTSEQTRGAPADIESTEPEFAASATPESEPDSAVLGCVLAEAVKLSRRPPKPKVPSRSLPHPAPPESEPDAPAIPEPELAEDASAEPDFATSAPAESEPSASSIIEPVVAEAVSAEPIRTAHATTISSSVATAESPGAERRESSAPASITMLDPFGFRSSIMRATAALNVAWTIWFKRYLTLSAEIFGSTMTVKPSGTDEGEKTPDAKES